MLKGILNIRIEHVLKGEPGTERQSTRKWHMEFDQNDVTLWWWYFVHLLCWGQELFNCTERKSTLFPSVSCSLSQRTDLYGYQRVLPMGNFNRKWEGEKRVRIGCLDCLPAGFPWVVCIAWSKSSFSPESLLQAEQRVLHYPCWRASLFSYFQSITGWYFVNRRQRNY